MCDKQYIQPSDTFESKRFGFTQVVTSPPGKPVFVSGQVGLDRDLKLVGELLRSLRVGPLLLPVAASADFPDRRVGVTRL